MVASLGLPDRGVKSAGFYVLRHSVMPAILTEGAFLTNPTEALLLADPAVRQRIAEAIGRGVQRYARGRRGHAAAAAADDRPVEDEAHAGPRRLPPGEDRAHQPGRPGRLARRCSAASRPPAPALAATIGPWRTRPASVPDGLPAGEDGPRQPDRARRLAGGAGDGALSLRRGRVRGAANQLPRPDLAVHHHQPARVEHQLVVVAVDRAVGPPAGPGPASRRAPRPPARRRPSSTTARGVAPGAALDRHGDAAPPRACRRHGS